MKLLKIVLLFICVFATAAVYAQSSTELKRQRDRMNEELQRLNHEYQDVVNSKKANKK